MKTKLWLGSVLLLLSGLAQANDPVPLKVLVGFGAGGSADLAARLLAERLKDELGRPVVVENRVGAGGRIAAEALKNAPPNGSTVMLAPIVVPVLAPLVFKKLNYDAQKDLAPVAHIADFQFGVSVTADSPNRNIADLVPVVKKNQLYAVRVTVGITHNFGPAVKRGLPQHIPVMTHRLRFRPPWVFAIPVTSPNTRPVRAVIPHLFQGCRIRWLPLVLPRNVEANRRVSGSIIVDEALNVLL